MVDLLVLRLQDYPATDAKEFENLPRFVMRSAKVGLSAHELARERITGSPPIDAGIRVYKS
jgi:hypothetical protein